MKPFLTEYHYTKWPSIVNLVQLGRVTPKEADGIYAEWKRYLEMVVMKICF